MANIWYLKIKVVDAQDAEKMKNYVRELNKEYTLMPTSDNPDDGWYHTGGNGAQRICASSIVPPYEL